MKDSTPRFLLEQPNYLGQRDITPTILTQLGIRARSIAVAPAVIAAERHNPAMNECVFTSGERDSSTRRKYAAAHCNATRIEWRSAAGYDEIRTLRIAVEATGSEIVPKARNNLAQHGGEAGVLGRVGNLI